MAAIIIYAVGNSSCTLSVGKTIVNAYRHSLVVMLLLLYGAQNNGNYCTYNTIRVLCDRAAWESYGASRAGSISLFVPTVKKPTRYRVTLTVSLLLLKRAEPSMIV